MKVALSEIRHRSATVERIHRYRAGDRVAGQELVRAHAPLIRTVTMRYSRPSARDWQDCLQEGRLGLLRACETWDDRDLAPATYFAIWIKSRVLRFLKNRGHVVRFPVHHYEKGHRGRLSIWKPRTILFSEMPDERGASMDLAFEDTLVDDGDLADETMQSEEIHAVIPHIAAWLVGRLAPRKRAVLTRRFSANRERLEDIAKDLGVTRKRTRQIEAEALIDCRRAARDAGFSPRHYDAFEAWIAGASEVLFEHASKRAA